MSIIAGALYGLGGAAQNVGMEALRAQLDEAKATKLEQIRAANRAQEQTRGAELDIKLAEAAAEISDRPRKEILAKANEPIPFRNVDESGNVYDDQYVDKRPGRMGIIASELGYADMAKKYRDANEPGFVEQNRITSEAQDRKDARAHENAKALKASPNAPASETDTERRYREALTRNVDARTGNEIDEPRRTDEKERRAAAQSVLQQSNVALKAIAEQLQSATGDERARLLMDQKTLIEQRGKAMAALDSPRGGGSTGGGGSSGTRPPLDAFEKGGGKSAPNTKPRENQPEPASRNQPRTSQFNRAEQELIDEQESPAAKQRVRNEILRRRLEDERRNNKARRAQEGIIGESEYEKRGIDPRRAAGL